MQTYMYYIHMYTFCTYIIYTDMTYLYLHASTFILAYIYYIHMNAYMHTYILAGGWVISNFLQ